MGDIGVPELLIILAIVLICFGPARLAGLGKSLGDGIRSFREGVRDDDRPTTSPAMPVQAETAGAVVEAEPSTVEPVETVSSRE